MVIECGQTQPYFGLDGHYLRTGNLVFVDFIDYGLLENTLDFELFGGEVVKYKSIHKLTVRTVVNFEPDPGQEGQNDSPQPGINSNIGHNIKHNILNLFINSPDFIKHMPLEHQLRHKIIITNIDHTIHNIQCLSLDLDGVSINLYDINKSLGFGGIEQEFLVVYQCSVYFQ